MTSIILKTCAIVLCLIFAFTIALPQAYAQWNQQDCQIGKLACLFATIVAEAICDNNPNSDACIFATTIAEAICELVDANCPPGN